MVWTSREVGGRMREEPAVREQVRDVDAVGYGGCLTQDWQPIAHIVDQAIVDGSQGARHGGRLRQPAALVKKAVQAKSVKALQILPWAATDEATAVAIEKAL
jgi:hypothetical protein